MKVKDIGAKGPTRKGLSRSPLYSLWRLMLDRCYVKKNVAYARYGGRGIKVCERWFYFDNFHDDNINIYIYGLEMDRIDNNKGYTKGNLRWVTGSENCRNRNTTVIGTMNGITKPIIDWSDSYGINNELVMSRIRDSGWDIKRALTTPVLDRNDNMLLAQKMRWEGHIKKPRPPKKVLNTVEYNGKTYTYKKLSDLCGVSVKLLNKRIRERGWDIERAIKNESFKGNIINVIINYQLRGLSP